VAVLVIVFMMIFVIPTFAKMFQGLGADLPLPRRSSCSYRSSRSGTSSSWWAWAPHHLRDQALLQHRAGQQRHRRLLVEGAGRRHAHPEGRRRTLHRTLGTLISSGVPILEGLLITARSAGNRVVERTVMQARTAVTSGRTLSEPLKGSTVFPPMVVHMISVGEKHGRARPDAVEDRDFYDDESTPRSPRSRPCSSQS